MITSPAKDLKVEAPRSPRLRLHEYVILGRTIDKCRALIAGTIGEFHFNCPLDNMLFDFKGISGDDFFAQVEGASSDEEIAAWLDQAGTPRNQEDIRQWSAKIESYKPFDDIQKRDWFVGECSPLNLDPRIATLFDYLEADDARMGK